MGTARKLPLYSRLFVKNYQKERSKGSGNPHCILSYKNTMQAVERKGKVMFALTQIVWSWLPYFKGDICQAYR